MVDILRSPSALVQSARRAFEKNLTKTKKFREKQLKGLLRFFEENEDAIVELVMEETRKSYGDARLEVILSTSHITYLLNHLKEFMEHEKVKKTPCDFLDTVYVCKEPFGVVLIMGAWNVPVLTLIPAAGAIAAGNAVVMKPSHRSPILGEYLQRTFPKYLDQQCYPVVLGGIDETNKLLEEKFDYIYYTGSTTVGKIVHQAANKHLTPTTLELGGKSPVYIDATADLKMAAKRIMWGKCMMSGQTCIAPDYILCAREVQAKFVEFARKALQELYDDNTFLPIVNADHFQRIAGLMKNLQIVVGGNLDLLNNSIEATIAVDVDPNHPVMDGENFAPILPILPINSAEQAVDYIKSKPKPLAIYVFSKNKAVKKFFLENTSSGGLIFNDTMTQLVVECLPFGGVGDSGMGLYKGRYSFDSFSHKKHVLDKSCSKLAEKINELRYPPQSKTKLNVVAFLFQSRKGVQLEWLVYVIVFLVGFLASYLIFKKW